MNNHSLIIAPSHRAGRVAWHGTPASHAAAIWPDPSHTAVPQAPDPGIAVAMVSQPGAFWLLACLLPAPLARTAAQQQNAIPVFSAKYGSALSEHARFGREVGHRFQVCAPSPTIGRRFALSRPRFARQFASPPGRCFSPVSSDLARALPSIAQAEIRRRYDLNNNTLLGWLVSYRATDNGRAAYDRLLANHNATYPQYVAELEGLAAGAEVPFSHVFMQNVRETLATLAWPDPSLRRERAPHQHQPPRRVDHCSDYAMWPYLVHNEDGDFVDAPTVCLAIESRRLYFFSSAVALLGRVCRPPLSHGQPLTLLSLQLWRCEQVYFVNVSVGGTRFTALCYAGDLASGAFGFNEHGIAFTLNYLGPNHVDPDGYGRGFISRALLETDTMIAATNLVRNTRASTGTTSSRERVTEAGILLSPRH